MTIEKELLAEARFQQDFAASDLGGKGATGGFIGLAFATADGHITGGHAANEDYRAAVADARRTSDTFREVVLRPDAPVVALAVITTRNLDDIPARELDAVKADLGLPAETPVILRRNDVHAVEEMHP